MGHRLQLFVLMVGIVSRNTYNRIVEGISPVIHFLYWPSLIAAPFFSAYWIWHVPSAGVAIGALGAVGVLVAIKGEKLRDGHRVIWAFITLAFLVTEVRAIHKEDAKHAEDMKEILRTYQNETEQNQRHFDATMKAHSAEIDSLKTSINLVTGDGSYIYLKIENPIGPMHWDFQNRGGKQDVMEATASPKLEGTYSLHDVQATISDSYGVSNIDYGTINPWPGKGIIISYLKFRPDKHRQHVHITINASNGAYYQGVLFLKIKEKWVWASRLYKGLSSDGTLIREWSSPDFPKSTGDIEWRTEDD